MFLNKQTVSFECGECELFYQRFICVQTNCEMDAEEAIQKWFTHFVEI